MKIKLFTHIDLDGIGCGILAKLAFNDNVDIEYCNYDDINKKIEDFIQNNECNNYSKIFITDISVDEEIADLVEKNIKDRVVLLDHHKTAEWLNTYSWAKVVETDKIYDEYESNKTSGTYLFYMYLIDNSVFDTKSMGFWLLKLGTFVEHVRMYDTWEFKTVFNNNVPKQWNDLLYILGRERFIDLIIEKINSRFEFTETDKLLLELNQEKIDKYIKSKQKQIIEKELLGYKTGIVFAEQYHSELGNTLATNNPHLDFIVIINPSYSVSYRSIKDNVHLGEDIANVYDGGGHAKAAGSPISDQIKDKIIDLIFGEKSCSDRKYVIYNFLNECVTGYYKSGNPCLTCVSEDAMIFSSQEAKDHLSKLHDMGYTGLRIKELVI